MKTLLRFSVLFLFVSFLACDKDDDPVIKDSEYYVFTYQGLDDPVYGAENGFFKVIPNAGSFTAERLNSYYPAYGWIDQYISFNDNGVCAFYCDPLLTPAYAESHVAYFTMDKPAEVHFLPLPEKQSDYTWTINTQKPRVLSNGKILVVMSIYTDIQFDDWHDEFVAVYDPATDEWDIGPSVTGFVLSQPEKGSDTELGSISYDAYTLSKDEQTVFLKAYGWGVDFGSVHIDARYIVGYDISSQDFCRVYLGDNQIYGATSGRLYFRSAQGKTAAVDLVTLDYYPVVDDYAYDYYIFARYTERIVKSWRGSGMGAITWNGSSYDWLHIINTDKLLSTTYAGLGGRPFFNESETAIYFTASKDFYTNYAAEFAVMKTPIIAENPEPEIQFIMPKNFSGFFYRHEPEN